MTYSDRVRDEETLRILYSEFYSKPASDSMEVVARSIMAPDWRGYGDSSGYGMTLDQMIATYREFGAAAPDLRVAPLAILHESGQFVVRSRLEATPAADFLGVAPSGRGFAILTIDIHAFENGRIVETYHVEDWAGAIRQLRRA